MCEISHVRLTIVPARCRRRADWNVHSENAATRNSESLPAGRAPAAQGRADAHLPDARRSAANRGRPPPSEDRRQSSSDRRRQSPAPGACGSARPGSKRRVNRPPRRAATRRKDGPSSRWDSALAGRNATATPTSAAAPIAWLATRRTGQAFAEIGCRAHRLVVDRFGQPRRIDPERPLYKAIRSPRSSPRSAARRGRVAQRRAGP